MKIPDSVKILYKEYKIVQQENLHSDGDDLYGQTQYQSEKIILNAESTEEQKKATLIHELLHGLDELYYIGLKEKQVGKLGNAIYMMVKDNPRLFEEGQLD